MKIEAKLAPHSTRKLDPLKQIALFNPYLL
jgi:hypothetical protein